MFALLRRELNSFLNSLTGTIVLAVFLIIVGLFLWVFPGAYNIIESGYANLQGLFNLTPYVFLFIIPALTMRFFADEKKTGTIEMLLTKPLTDTQIVLSKWMAGTFLTLFALLPTLVYFAFVSAYAFAPGVDAGGTWGSYLGLFLLGSTFVAIGLFASSLTDNQIVSFVVAFFLCGFAFIGFELLHALGIMGKASLFVRNLGIHEHYISMSRGVIDSRDVAYFSGMILIFLMLTKINLESRKWGGSLPAKDGAGKPTSDLRRKHLLQLTAGLLLIVLLNFIGTVKFFRLDLTAEKRHSLTQATRSLLKELDDMVYVRVYLEGDFPAGFIRLRNQTREVLDEFRAYTGMIQYEFVNPARTGDRQQVQNYYDMLMAKGLQPAQIQVRADDASSQQIIFPGAILKYRDKEIAVQLLQAQLGISTEEMLNNSAQLLEYGFINAISQLTVSERPTVAFLESHGGPVPEDLTDISNTLRQYYQLKRVHLNNDFHDLDNIHTLIVAKPTATFSEQDKFIIDQFVMRGGSVLWLVEPVLASMDSLAGPSQETIGIPWSVNLEDMLFRYGVRLNANLLMDLQSAPIAVTTGVFAGQPQISMVPWPYFPLLSPANEHPIVRNINMVRSEFVSSLDTIEVPGVKKTLLLTTSPYTRTVAVPALIDLKILQEPFSERLYSGPPAPVAVLLEGSFESLFRNRINPGIEIPDGQPFREYGLPASMIVVTDGDIIRNQFTTTGQPLPLGYDRYSGETFGNKEFIVNAVNYLTGGAGIITARNKEIRLRMLDKTRIKQNSIAIQTINLALPVAMVLLTGFLLNIRRKWKYTRKYA